MLISGLRISPYYPCALASAQALQIEYFQPTCLHNQGGLETRPNQTAQYSAHSWTCWRKYSLGALAMESKLMTS